MGHGHVISSPGESLPLLAEQSLFHFEARKDFTAMEQGGGRRPSRPCAPFQSSGSSVLRPLTLSLCSLKPHKSLYFPASTHEFVVVVPPPPSSRRYLQLFCNSLSCVPSPLFLIFKSSHQLQPRIHFQNFTFIVPEVH